MGRYTGPTERISRRIGINIFDKFRSAIEKEWRQTAPGQHGWRRGRLSEYGQRLQEKQKLKYHYGLREPQFMRYFNRASRMKGNTGENLLVLLERRLDNALFKAGLAHTHRQARQMVTHGHVRVNARRVDRPSFELSIGDEITLKDRDCCRTVAKKALAEPRRQTRDTWLMLDEGSLTVKVVGLPTREDVIIPVDEQMVVEICGR